MIGSIAGDIIGSVYEFNNIKTKAFPLFSPLSRFTDDTVLTIALANAIISGIPYVESIREFGRAYPSAGYGGSFKNWLFSENTTPYNSWGNGSAMRVSPVGFAFNSIDDVLKEARLSAEITHNHPEGIKGAQATALAIYLARKGADRDMIKKEIHDRLNYDLDRSVDEIRVNYTFDVSCQGTVPEAIICFLESRSYEDAIRNAISLGGDSDTLACITGGISEAFYGAVPEDIIKRVKEILPDDLMNIVNNFYKKFMN
ncbi:MAG: ADP-ribosylglycohydrolase family protein [Desulfatiglans sp.]|jgi:ADP-ribosylglycohydrolase|nr:ADP-ribosylglycohydrolase family protein [Desulfatiglans sp.]